MKHNPKGIIISLYSCVVVCVWKGEPRVDTCIRLSRFSVSFASVASSLPSPHIVRGGGGGGRMMLFFFGFAE